jgi:acyl-activating enzyme 14
MKMEDYVYENNIFLTLGRIEKKMTIMKDEQWKFLEKKTLGTIRLCLETSMAFNISKENTMEYMMKGLAKLYEKTSASNKVFLMKRLFNMKMSKGGSVVDYLNDFNIVTSQLSSVGITFDDEVRDILIFCSLLKRWNGLVMAMSNSISSSNTLKFYDVVGVILGEEM